jgi:PAS domain S-box-containing protein
MNPQPIALLVNDDPTQLRLAASILMRDGYEVLACQDAEAALQQLDRRGGADVVITDLYMPGIDGWRFCRLLRSSAYKAFNTIPILVVSATFSGADAEELTAQLGADGFLSAPYEARALRQMVRDVLGNGKHKSPTRVLIVEPDSAEADLLANTFDQHGYTVTHAADGAAGLRRFRADRPHLVILNYALPDMPGRAVLEAIREPGGTTVTIVVTTDTSAEHALELLRSGADNYAPKPLLPEYLLHICEIATRQRALLRVEELLEMRTRKLRDSEERYRNLFENAAIGLVTYALDGTVIAVNRNFETLSQRSRDDLIGKSQRDYLTDEGYAEARQEQDRACAGKQHEWVHELALLRPDGSRVAVEARCCFLRGPNQEAGLIMAMYRDLTVEKALQRQRAEFAAMLAHDIRNPVGLIANCISLLVDEEHEADPELVKRCHLRILDDSRLLQSLVNNYLDISTIEAGQLKLNRRPVDLGELLRNLVQRFGREASSRSIVLNLDIQDCPGFSGDVLLLERIFGNLMQNALKFTPDRGHITVATAARDNEAVVSIRDNGPGIEPDKLPSLFQKFERLESRENHEGLGLGLYIVKELVQAHGGRVEVQSVLGEGSCFTIFLPLFRAVNDAS